MWGRPDEPAFEGTGAKKTWGGATWKGEKKSEPKTAFRGDRFFLSNMYKCPVMYQGVKYNCAETAFQAQKCADDAERQTLVAMEDPFEVKKAAYKVKKREDWQEVKVGIMREIVYAKFAQNHDLAEKLLATGEEHLAEENKWNDRFWGTVNGEGENHLGKILMEVRTNLRESVAEFGGLPPKDDSDVPVEAPAEAPVAPETASKPDTVSNVIPFETTVPDAPETSQKVSDWGVSKGGWGQDTDSVKELIKRVARGNDLKNRLSEKTFEEMKQCCLQIAEGKIPAVSFRSFKPAEYKYFSELLWLYRRFVSGHTAKENAMKEEAKLREQYKEDSENEIKYYESILRWNHDIRLSEMCRASMNKCDDKDVALDLALQAIAAMTGDKTVMSVTREKYLAGKPKAVTYDVSPTFYLPEEEKEKVDE